MAMPPAVGDLVEWVVDGVGVVRPPVGYAGAASLVLAEGDDVVLVDAGLAPEQRAKLAPHVDVLILSHAHVAHSHGAADFERVWVPREEADALASLDAYLDALDVARRDRALVEEHAKKAGFQPIEPTKRLSPGGILRLASSEWHLIEAPGHSPGMICLLDNERHILFTSDIDVDRPPWYGVPSSDPSDLERSIVMLEEIPTAYLITSHAPVRRRGIRPGWRHQLETFRERDRRLLAVLEKPRSLDALAQLGLVGDKPATPLEAYHQRVMVEKHLRRLMEKDFVAARQDGRFARV